MPLSLTRRCGHGWRDMYPEDESKEETYDKEVVIYLKV